MKEKTRTIIVAGSVLVGLIALALLIPGDALEKRPTNLSAEQVEQQNAIITESLEAIKEFDARGEESPRVYYNEYKILAGAYVRLGDMKKAREAYLNMARYSEIPEVDYKELVDLEVENGNYREARSVLSTLVAENSENFAYWDMLIVLEKKYFDLAGEDLRTKIEESIEATNRSTGSLVTYAYFLEEEGDYARALEYWKEAAAQNPEYDHIYSGEISRVEALIAEQE